jgi:hypothetical protein
VRKVRSRPDAPAPRFCLTEEDAASISEPPPSPRVESSARRSAWDSAVICARPNGWVPGDR